MLSIVLALAASVSDTDLAAHFKAGQRLCTNPNAAAKTCANIDWMEMRSDGELINSGETLISVVPLYTLEVASISHFENGQMCGTIKAEDLQHGIVRLNGEPLPPVENFAALNNLLAAIDHLVGTEICQGLRIDKGRLVMFARADRKGLPIPVASASWITPAQGYRVAAPNNGK